MSPIAGRICVAALSLTVGSAAAQQDFSGVEIKHTHVAGNVHMLVGSGGNIGVSAGPDGILMIDDQFAPLADKIRAALKEMAPGKLEFVLNTHWHGDHTGGNTVFGPEVPIVAHTNVRKRLSTSQELFGRVIEPLPPGALPVITFDESLSIHFNGEELRMLHYAHSHTDGDSIVVFGGSNVVHMGDLMFAGMFPFVDLDHGGDVEGLVQSIEKIISGLPADVKIIPGHGPLSNLDDLKAYHRMLTETTMIVRQQIQAGRTLEQVQRNGLPSQWDKWGTGFIKTDRWLETVFKSLSKS